jgi:O-6-methylguanine DNA methyltransferase
MLDSVTSQSNVRRIKAGVSIEELAEDIARRGLLQGLSVRAVVGADGVETGMFEIPAGGRRYRALELLVKQKRLAAKLGTRDARDVTEAIGSNAIAILIPCHRVVKKDGSISGYRWGVRRKRILLQRERQTELFQDA